ncbi:MAG: Fic family protein [Candidatus Woesebacteria bacterium GW2011_GWA2_40_7b]|uniref:Fic family protein n=1 Tax=Candidatus Woesebacteria bacterium GW2011_GWA2_40_7b TaxID=1618563 RepID=A0A0G0W7N5_9BACT|nr:MAG: Fic family protein [Candidatus Woesebacteria bacterium GW2011_GWA2_40_7b]
MNDTKLNPRQRQILELIARSDNLSRLGIKEKLTDRFQASIPTIARDLVYLLKNNLIAVHGNGRNTSYSGTNISPLLKYFDIDQYFSVGPDQRTDVGKGFNFDIFDNLTNLFTPVELSELSQIYENFHTKSETSDKDIYLKEVERFVIELSWKSSKIEGNTYSLLDTETLIKQKTEAQGHPKDEAVMILNHKRAFESILAKKEVYKILTFTKITQLHNLLIEGLNVSTGIRKQAVGITGTIYRPLDNEWQIREAMEKLICVINESKNPLEKALITIAIISYIQPFTDGNKRTARMLANAVLLANDYYPLSYRSVDETFYKKALVLFYEQNSLFYLKQIILDQYKFALNTYFK